MKHESRSGLKRFVCVFMLSTLIFGGEPANAQKKAPEIENSTGINTRIELAEQYLLLMHREKHLQNVYEKQLQMSMNYCEDAACQTDLDRAILAAVRSSAFANTRELARLYAQRLTEGQLRALVRFGKSPDGQAISRATDGMNDELARLGHEMALRSYAAISRTFCQSHPHACETRPVPSVQSPETQRD